MSFFHSNLIICTCNLVRMKMDGPLGGQQGVNHMGLFESLHKSSLALFGQVFFLVEIL